MEFLVIAYDGKIRKQSNDASARDQRILRAYKP